jgi:hypothetical protein
MVQGDEVLEQVRFIEGWTCASCAPRWPSRAAPQAAPRRAGLTTPS